SEGLSPSSGLTQNRLPKESDARQSKWREGVPIAGIDIHRSYCNDYKHDNYLDADHGRIERCAFANSFDQDESDDSRDHEGRKIHHLASRHQRAQRGIEVERRIGKCKWNFYSENADEILKIMRPSMRHSCRSDGIFENEIPAYDPGK